jgi:peptidoglycan/LPS O-acetylase OafA/YrhL
MGIVCFRVWERRNVLTSRGNPQAIGGFAIILSILILLTQPAGITSMLGDSLYTQGLAFLLLTLGLSISPIKIIVNKYFNWLGSLSYSIYLLHPIIIWTSQDLISTIYTLLPSSLAFISSTLLILTMVVTVSFISEKIIESPFIALGKKISRRFFV